MRGTQWAGGVNAKRIEFFYEHVVILGRQPGGDLGKFWGDSLARVESSGD